MSEHATIEARNLRAGDIVLVDGVERPVLCWTSFSDLIVVTFTDGTEVRCFGNTIFEHVGYAE